MYDHLQLGSGTIEALNSSIPKDGLPDGVGAMRRDVRACQPRSGIANLLTGDTYAPA